MRMISVPLLSWCLAVCLSVPAGAQQAPGAQTVQPAAKAPVSANAGPITIRGCVSGGAEAYTLAQSGTGTVFKLQGDSRHFESLRGKQVEVRAREFPPARNAGLTELPRLAVDEVRVIGDRCPVQAKGKPAERRSTIPPKNRSNTRSTHPNAATPRYQPPGAPDQTAPKVGNNPNVGGANGAPSPGTGNPPSPPKK